MRMDSKRREIITAIETQQKKFLDISDAIWGYAELGLEEFQSSKLLADTLETSGFHVDRGAAGMPTAFVATWCNGTGQPVIGLTAEYDALVAMSQKPGLSYQEALVPGAPGHACSHHTMGALQSLAAVSMSEFMLRHGLNGTLKVFGCPAEELGVSRPFLIRAGLFKDVDVVIDCHPDSMFKATFGKLGNALYSFLVTFHGKASHAGWTPWLGRSAADAVDLMHAATERMREHLPPTNRNHWINTYGGDAPNIVPDRATTWYYLRDQDENMEAAIQWVHDCAQGAALMTQTVHDIQVLAAVHQRFYNRGLAEVLFQNIQAVGKPQYTSAEEDYARALQKSADYPVKGMDYPMEFIFAEEQPFKGSSSDVGDLTLVVPTSLLSYPVWVPGSPAHHWTAVSAGTTSIAHKGTGAGAKVVALTIYDLLTDDSLLAKIKTEFSELTRRRPYTPFLLKEARPPFGFYAEAMEKIRRQLDGVLKKP